LGCCRHPPVDGHLTQERHALRRIRNARRRRLQPPIGHRANGLRGGSIAQPSQHHTATVIDFQGLIALHQGKRAETGRDGGRGQRMVALRQGHAGLPSQRRRTHANLGRGERQGQHERKAIRRVGQITQRLGQATATRRHIARDMRIGPARHGLLSQLNQR